ncbi:MAG: molybdenum cofactor guanylyltransferase [Bacteroidales bacterium]|nr:molybdenum cofactor guanylyltransferase [Bacteroidales bacterium]
MNSSWDRKQISGVVLAGGKSSRFGQDKGLFPFRGKALVEHAIDILKPLCSEILISTNNPDAYGFTGQKTIADIHAGCGPIGGMHSGLFNASGQIVLFLGCDMPFVDSKVFSFLLENIAVNHAAVAMHNGFRETLCMALKKESLPLVEQAIAEKKYKILDMLEMLSVSYPELSTQSFFHRDMFHNINFREDLPPDRKQ